MTARVFGAAPPAPWRVGRVETGLRLAWIVAWALVVFVFSAARPVYNWDLVGYVAAHFHDQGLAGPDLLARTFDDIRAGVPPQVYAELTTGQWYRETVASDPESLRQQIPFYAIRPAYLGLVGLASRLTGSVVAATVLVSAAAAGLVALVVGLALRHGGRLGLALYPAALFGSGILAIGRQSTPDTLAALVALLALLAMPRHERIGLALLALAPLVRTDFVLLMPLVLAALWWQGRRLGPWHLLAAGVSVGLVVGINRVAGNYGTLVLWQFTFLEPEPNPYPATLAFDADPREILGVYWTGVRMLLMSPTAAWLALGAAFGWAMWRRGAPSWRPLMTLVAVAFALAHFTLFPNAHGRHYYVAMAMTLILLMQAADALRRVEDPADAMSRDGA